MSQLPRIRAELDRNVDGATSDEDRMLRQIHRGQILAMYAEPVDAKASFESAVAIARSLSTGPSASLQSQRDLRTAVDALCDFEWRYQRDYARASANCQEGLAIARHLVVVEGGSDDANRELVESLFLVGIKAVEQNDGATALAMLKEARDVSRGMVNRYPKTDATRYFWQAHVIYALEYLTRMPGSGVRYSEYADEKWDREHDMKDHGFSDPITMD